MGTGNLSIEEAPPAAPTPARGLLASVAPLAGVRPERVALLARESLTVRVIQALCRQEVLELVPAATAGELGRRLAGGAPDIAFVELDPARRGDDVASLVASVRALPGCAQLPVGVVSVAGLETRLAASASGAQVFLSRPFDAGAFGTAARRLLGLRSGQGVHVLVAGGALARAHATGAALAAAGVQASFLDEPSRLFEVLDQQYPELVVLDGAATSPDPLALCRALRMTPRWGELPIMLVGGGESPQARIAAADAGVDDRLPADASGEELVVRVLALVRRARANRERADRDPLTGLLLRRPFLELLSLRIAEAQRHERTIAVGVLDLDYFKNLNDRYGHLAGDRVLAHFGRFLAGRLRSSDLRARWGGEEFALALPGESAESAATVLRRLLDEFSSFRFIGDDAVMSPVSFSAGVAAFPAEGASAERLLRVADRRLYEAKRAGRRRVVEDDGVTP